MRCTFCWSGEISVKERRFDKVLNEWVDDEKGPIGHGTMFGEQELLHNIVRSATFLTLSRASDADGRRIVLVTDRQPAKDEKTNFNFIFLQTG
ncbi:hypothetical protein NQ318_010532 [Aromia moschata]|uniref:Cyclic nucleotide-binding domain-containing protein n=1 Tax=Aromia moschata TaxID=1265417 RepID=A0AAV8YH42_9CUCU|nr:hypothetical protein NQ318_010532 [Aromia moschata]